VHARRRGPTAVCRCHHYIPLVLLYKLPALEAQGGRQGGVGARRERQKGRECRSKAGTCECRSKAGTMRGMWLPRAWQIQQECSKQPTPDIRAAVLLCGVRCAVECRHAVECRYTLCRRYSNYWLAREQ